LRTDFKKGLIEEGSNIITYSASRAAETGKGTTLVKSNWRRTVRVLMLLEGRTLGLPKRPRKKGKGNG